jgi:GntR family transcriptional repressor for pyruvate dehydrogenase complex
MEIERTTLSAHVAKGIVDEITTQRLAPGDQIAAESEIAERYGVNRLVVREAIRTLVAREILVSSQGKRARVSTPSPAVFEQILAFRLSQESMALADVVDARRVIETALVSRAAARIADGTGDTSHIRASLNGMREAGDDREAFVVHDLGFHQAISDLADATILSFILTAMQGVLLDTRRASYDSRSKRERGLKVTLAEHQQILDAIELGNPDAAAQAMAQHLSETHHNLGP